MAVSVDLVAWAWVMLCWGGWGAVFAVKRQPPAPRVRRRDLSSLIGFGAQILAYAAVLVWNRGDVGPIAAMPRWAALGLAMGTMILALASVAITLAARAALGGHWSLQARVLEDHRLIVSGPYRLVRHPIYAGMLGMLLATALVVSRWPVILPALLVFALGTAIRIRSEERLLGEAFGADFRAYVRSVPAVVPFLW